MTTRSSNALREGFREVFRDPALLLIEIGWRWTFGAIALLTFFYCVFLLMGSVAVDTRRLEQLSAIPAFQLLQTISDSVTVFGRALLKISVAAVFVLAVLWIPLSALGRYATLARPALFPGASLRACFLVSGTRALLTLGSLVAWMIAGMVAGFAGSVNSRGPLPSPGIVLGIVVPVSFVIVTVWSVLNWYCSFTPLFSASEATSIIDNQRAFLRERRDELLEVSTALGIVRVGLVIVSFLLCLGVSSIVQNPRIALADLFAIALLYFLAADFLYMVRMAAYANLRNRSQQHGPITY